MYSGHNTDKNLKIAPIALPFRIDNITLKFHKYVVIEM